MAEMLDDTPSWNFLSRNMTKFVAIGEMKKSAANILNFFRYKSSSKEYDESGKIIENYQKLYNISLDWMKTIYGPNITDSDIHKYVKYLFPSGLKETHYRPTLQDQSKFYTRDQNILLAGKNPSSSFFSRNSRFSDIIYKVESKIAEADQMLHKMMQKPKNPFQRSFVNDIKIPVPKDSKEIHVRWISVVELLKMIGLTRLLSIYHSHLIARLQALSEHPLSWYFRHFLAEYQIPLTYSAKNFEPIEKSSDGSIQSVGYRKTSIADVRLYPGTGKFTVNCLEAIDYLKYQLHVDQAVLPLLVTERREKYDIEAQVISGGYSGQAGAIRLAVAQALASFEPDLMEQLAIGGLLQRDFRKRERKKCGRQRARKKDKWRAR